MALSERSRSALYQALSQTIDEEAVSEMLTHFPARDVDEPVTREHLDRRFAELRGEFQTDLADVRAELRTGLAEVRGELDTGLAGVRGELHTGLAEVRTQIAASANRMLAWLMATIIATAVLAVAVSARLSG